MKKILFIALAVAGISNLASAQAAKISPTMTPPPSKAQLEKDSKAKSDAAQLSVPVTPAKQTAKASAATAKYKKAGLNDSQVAMMNDFDKRKADIQNNTTLTPEQKKNAIAAIEAERNASLRKSLGEDGYKKYTVVTAPQAKTKPVKSAN